MQQRRIYGLTIHFEALKCTPECLGFYSIGFLRHVVNKGGTVKRDFGFKLFETMDK
jgi:hypothetical protein